MKSLILSVFVLICAFGSEVLVDNKESFKNNSYIGTGTEFSKNSENSSGEILVKKYKKWEDLENEWEEKWQRDESGAAQKYKNLSKDKNE